MVKKIEQIFKITSRQWLENLSKNICWKFQVLQLILSELQQITWWKTILSKTGEQLFRKLRGISYFDLSTG